MVVVDEASFAACPARSRVYRAALALIDGDVAGPSARSPGTRSRRPRTTISSAAPRRACSGLATGRAGTSRPRIECTPLRGRPAAGRHLSDVLGCSIALADIRITQGRLRDAMRTYEQALQLSANQGEPVLRGTADMHVGMSELSRERGDLEAATGSSWREARSWASTSGSRRTATAGMSRWPASGRLKGTSMARSSAPRGRAPVHARTSSRTCVRRRGARHGSAPAGRAWPKRMRGPGARPVAARRPEVPARVRARHACEGAPGPVHRTSLRRSARDAFALLGRLLRAAEDGQRTGNVIEILVLLALAHQVRGDMPAALAALGRALALANRKAMFASSSMRAHPWRPCCRTPRPRNPPGATRAAFWRLVPARPRTPRKQPLIEPLSERELDVLRLLGTDLADRRSPASSWCR